MMPFSGDDHLLKVTEDGWKMSGHIDSDSMAEQMLRTSTDYRHLVAGGDIFINLINFYI